MATPGCRTYSTSETTKEKKMDGAKPENMVRGPFWYISRVDCGLLHELTIYKPAWNFDSIG